MRALREKPRVRLGNILYVDLSPGNGGIVLDLSEKGLALQAADRLEETEQIRFRFLAPSLEQVEVTGDLIWADETRKKGGVRFSNLPEEVRKEVKNWLGQARSEALPSHFSSVPGRSSESNPFRTGSKSSPTASPLAKEPARRGTKYWTVSSAKAESFPPTNDLLEYARIAKSAKGIDSNDQYVDRTSGSKPLMIALVLLLGVAIGVLAFVYKDREGHSLILLGEKISGAPAHTRPTIAPAPGMSIAASPPLTPLDNNPIIHTGPPSGPSTASSVVRAGGTSGSRNEANSSQTRESQTKSNPESWSHSAPKRSDFSKGGEDGETELSLARQYLAQVNNVQAKSRAAKLLWLAVEKGSSEAELDLADLYARGEGVPKNCKQAQILLTAARTGNNLLAGKESVELYVYGCR